MYKVIFFTVFLNFFGKLIGCVYVTVSSVPPNKIELNWNYREPIQSIKVYDEDPSESSDSKPLTQISVIEHPIQHYKTNITFNAEPFPGGWSYGDTTFRNPRSHCLYWTVTQYQNQSLQTNCFKIRPAWMAENKMKLKDLSLPFMFIPGTHNSGTDAMRVSRKRSLGNLDDLVLTQDQTIWNQLVYGIRFLDFRIGYYPQNSDPNLRFWINHDLLRIQPLIPVLKDIFEFSKASPDEIIILDFHRFPTGFKSKNALAIHRELIKLIETELGNLIIPRPLSQSKLKLKDIWNSEQRIVISYSEDNIVWETPWLWSSVSQRWGNKQTPESLERFLDNTFREVTPRKLWAAMAELTPTPLDFLGNGSLKEMADTLNPQLNTWFTEKQNWTSRANIVAPDFFLGTNLIEIAIGENLRRAKDDSTI